MDSGRGYSPDSLARVGALLDTGHWDLAVGIPPPRRFWPFRLAPATIRAGIDQPAAIGDLRYLFRAVRGPALGYGTMSRLDSRPDESSLILDLLSRHRVRCIDVPVDGGGGFRSRGVGIGHVRPLKHLLDLRFGNYSRLVQFCIVGASGMVVDLSFYALFQWLFSFTQA